MPKLAISAGMWYHQREIIDFLLRKWLLPSYGGGSSNFHFRYVTDAVIARAAPVDVSWLFFMEGCKPMAERDSLLSSQISLIVSEIKAVLDSARSNVAQQVNKEMLGTYWNIGRILCEYQQSNPNRADYGKHCPVN